MLSNDRFTRMLVFRLRAVKRGFRAKSQMAVAFRGKQSGYQLKISKIRKMQF